MRIISQNGCLDIPYDGARIHVRENDAFGEDYSYPDAKEWVVEATYRADDDNQFMLATYDTEEESKDLLISIAKSWMRNYPIFFCNDRKKALDGSEVPER